MLVLGIESSCDETAAAVVLDGRKILSSKIMTSLEEHKAFGGVVPEIASRAHAESIVKVVDAAISEARVTLKDIDIIAVTYAPGLIGSLLVGVNFSKALALALNKDLVPIHHLRAHIASNYLAYKDLTPPFLSLVVSGGHTYIIEVKDYTEFKIIGKTRDDAAGETFDKAARVIGLPYPGGVELDKIAELGDSEKFTFKRPKLEGSEYDFSFSGLKTSFVNLVHNNNQKGIKFIKEDLAASFRQAVGNYLVDNFLKAAKDLNYKKITICGGVSANSLLRKLLEEEAKKEDLDLYLPPKSLCSDNAAMVAAQGYYEYKNKNVASFDLNAYANMPIDILK